MYRHEFRTFTQVHRRHYTTNLLAYETLYGSLLSDIGKESFQENYKRQTRRLKVFNKICSGGTIFS